MEFPVFHVQFDEIIKNTLPYFGYEILGKLHPTRQLNFNKQLLVSAAPEKTCVSYKFSGNKFINFFIFKPGLDIFGVNIQSIKGRGDVASRTEENKRHFPFFKAEFTRLIKNARFFQKHLHLFMADYHSGVMNVITDKRI